MIQTIKNYIKQRFFAPGILEKNPVDAYDIRTEKNIIMPIKMRFMFMKGLKDTPLFMACI